jgi:hypothetical protein
MSPRAAVALALTACLAGGAHGAEGPDKRAKPPAKKPAPKALTHDALRTAVVYPARGERASSLDGLLRETMQDLGLVLESRIPKSDRNAEESDLPRIAETRRALVIVPTLRSVGNELELRMMAARPGSRVVMTRVERIARDDMPLRAVVMLRDLVRESRAQPVERAAPPPPKELAQPARSAGRAILSVNGTLYGAFVGFSLQRASGSDDPRLLYPLLGVGAGIGLGAALIVSDEWDVGVGDAWYLAAGAWWPAVAGHLIYEGRFGDTPTASDDEAWSFGLIFSTTGFTLSTVALVSSEMGDGGAVLAHSGGALGLIVGGLTEFAVTGVSNEFPFAGMGYGAAAGWLLASATAVHFHPDAVRTLTIDLGILLGGLAGASAASPLLFDDATPAKTRGWVAATGGGLIAGGVLAWWLSRPDDAPAEKTVEKTVEKTAWLRYAVPRPSLIGTPPALGEIAAPGPGLEFSGELP